MWNPEAKESMTVWAEVQVVRHKFSVHVVMGILWLGWIHLQDFSKTQDSHWLNPPTISQNNKFYLLHKDSIFNLFQNYVLSFIMH